MIESLNFYELKHIIKWFGAINGNSSTLGDLQKYIIKNNIKTKCELMNKLHAEFVKIED